MDTLREVRRSGETFYEGYDTAQICENGDVITTLAESNPRYRKEHCSKCGATTVTACENCNEKIRGYLHGTMPSIGEEPAPRFCHNCGKPYPWTEKGITAARELISEAENLKPEEREYLSKSLDDLTCDSPGTQVAAIRFKKFISKAGKETADALRKIIVDVASETAKKILFP